MVIDFECSKCQRDREDAISERRSRLSRPKEREVVNFQGSKCARATLPPHDVDCVIEASKPLGFGAASNTTSPVGSPSPGLFVRVQGDSEESGLYSVSHGIACGVSAYPT
jgi:hypothetical protein